MASIIDQAIQLEEKTESNYRNAAQTTSDPSAAKILELLADEEAQHADVLRGMSTLDNLHTEDLQTQAEEWIHGAVEGGASKISSDAGLLAVLRRAMELEKSTEGFYREHADTTSNAETRSLFESLAALEKGHFMLIGSWVEYFDRPNEWIENAEFGHRDEY